MIANSRQILYFADSLGSKKCSFVKQQFEHMMQETLQSHPGVCCFYTIYAAFHLFKFPLEEITGIHDVSVLSVISNYIKVFNFSNVGVQVTQCLCYYLFTLTNCLKHYNLFTALNLISIRTRNEISACVISYQDAQ